MQLTALTTTHAARIPRRQSLVPPLEIEELLVDRSSMFPAKYHAVGECLAHPQRPCKCIKTLGMAQLPADAWHELGRRFKETRDSTAAPDRPALARRSSMPKERGHVASPVAAACGRMRRTASTGTPGAALVCCGTAVSWMRDSRLLDGCPAPARSSEAKGIHEVRAGGMSLPKPVGFRRRVDDRDEVVAGHK